MKISRRFIKNILYYLILIFAIFSILGFSKPIYATQTTEDLINGIGTIKANSSVLSISGINDIINTLGTAVQYASVGALIVIGIKYLLGSVEQKAQNKQFLINYVYAAILGFGVPQIIKFATEFGDKINSVESLGRTIIYILTFFSSTIAFAVLLFIGIKYLMASVDEKAAYKTVMLPYIIGCFLVFGASKIASILYTTINNIK